jgi:hypothetical protein
LTAASDTGKSQSSHTECEKPGQKRGCTWHGVHYKGKAEGIWQGKGGELPKGTRKILEVMEILRQVLSKYVQHIVL